MNKKRLKSIAVALKGAKPYLATKYTDRTKTEFICHALSNASLKGAISEDSARLAQLVILDRIYPDTVAENWLRNKVGEEAISADLDAIQTWRHAWVDQLIQEFA